MKPRKIIRQDWREAAQCAGQDPAAWDVEAWPRLPKGGDRAAVHNSRAAALCTGCPVLAECAADALKPLAVATVRAGVAIPPNPTGDPRRRVLARLQDIARGVHSCVARA